MFRALLCFAFALCACGRESDKTPTPDAPGQVQGAGAPVQGPLDPRVAVLYDPTMAGPNYAVDLSETTPVLVEVLLRGSHDPLKRAKMELASSAHGVAAARRLVDNYQADPEGVGYLRNAADVLSLSAEPQAAEGLWRLLEQPSESLRMQAVRGLVVHPRPESFDPLMRALATASAEFQAEVCLALGRIDPARAEELWVSWIDKGDNPRMWPVLVPVLAKVRNPALVERIRGIFAREGLESAYRLWLAAPLARAGDPEPLALLRAARESKNPTERDYALRALISAELFAELEWTLTHDEAAGVRALAVGALAQEPSSEGINRLLSIAANDANDQVRLVALGALAERGSAAAVDAAFALLDSPILGEVQTGIQVLRKPMQTDGELARRVWDKLSPRLSSADLRTPVERAMLVKVLGQIPLAEGSRTLLELAVRSQDDLEGMRAQRFILRQSVNAGRVAQDALFELWSQAQDPTLRLDAIEAFSALGGDDSRELLIRVLDEARTTPQELVYVADRLVRIGPASEVAWQIKRATLRVEDPAARSALQGLLWRWYPEPKN